MCKICVGICKDIETIFGHVVDPAKLARLIESSPVKAPDPQKRLLRNDF